MRLCKIRGEVAEECAAFVQCSYANTVMHQQTCVWHVQDKELDHNQVLLGLGTKQCSVSTHL